MIRPTVALLFATACSSVASHPTTSNYEELVALFQDWRAFEQPTFVDGVPDYSPAAMTAQRRELTDYQARVGAFETSGWPVEQQVDHHLVRAELNGLDFDHRVRRPWARNPSFYTTIFSSRSDVPAHEGPIAHGWIDLWTYEYPLNADDAAELVDRIGAIPGVLEQARGNLVEDARDLWVGGIRSMRAQSNDLGGFADRVAGTSTALDAAIAAARRATEEFRDWLEGELPSKNGPSGVGKDNYTWYAHNVHLVPYTWDEQLIIMRRELARAHASLRLEEHRNRDLPPLEQVAGPAEYDRVFNAAVTEYMRFLEEEDIVTVRDYMDAALRARIGAFSPSEGVRGFFSEVSYRNALTMRTHGHHWIELANMDFDPHASEVRRLPSLSNIYDARSEGFATGMEEWMMHAGLFDDNPRARELIWILLIQRAARAIGGLMLHANEMTVAETSQFASEWVPRGFLPADGATIVGEQHFYLQQPGYGTSYVIGKVQIERLLAERANQLGDAFTLKGFMDEFSAAGVIPVSLARWQLTGQSEEVSEMTTGGTP